MSPHDLLERFSQRAHQGRCPVCRTSFTTSSNRHFCSHACRQRHYEQRRRAKLQQYRAQIASVVATTLHPVALALVTQRIQEPDPEIRQHLDSLAEKHGIS